MTGTPPAEPDDRTAVPPMPPHLIEAIEWFTERYTNRTSPAALVAMAWLEGYAAGLSAATAPTAAGEAS